MYGIFEQIGNIVAKGHHDHLRDLEAICGLENPLDIKHSKQSIDLFKILRQSAFEINCVIEYKECQERHFLISVFDRPDIREHSSMHLFTLSLVGHPSTKSIPVLQMNYLYGIMEQQGAIPNRMIAFCNPAQEVANFCTRFAHSVQTLSGANSILCELL